jgi:protein-ribulosamine 3-kinase
MLSFVPDQIRERLIQSLHIELKSFSFSGGGCINHGGRLITSSGNYFLKWNDARQFPGMFEAEKKGLTLLSSPGVIRTPVVILAGETGPSQFLLLEYIEARAKSETFWESLGTQLAGLHSNTAADFGADHNNYIGSLPQINTPKTDWIDFYIHQRLEVQIRLARDAQKISSAQVLNFERLFAKLPDLLLREPPALLHGDLWSGNLITGDNGEPVLIDPAIYYGHRECEIAFTELFGGFPPAFYDRYNEVMPLQPGYQDRFEIYNLYPLMVHVNLFGGGYLSQVVSILRHLV